MQLVTSTQITPQRILSNLNRRMLTSQMKHYSCIYQNVYPIPIKNAIPENEWTQAQFT